MLRLSYVSRIDLCLVYEAPVPMGPKRRQKALLVSYAASCSWLDAVRALSVLEIDHHLQAETINVSAQMIHV